MSEISFIDPWWDLYLPASFGEVDAVLDALEAAELLAVTADRAELYAVAARSFLVIGRFVEAERLAERAFAAGGPEADALATFMRGDGTSRALERMAAATRPGLAADAACDLAALRLANNDATGARAAIARAEELCPGHREAARWARLLGTEGDLRNILRDSRDPRRARRATPGPVLDAVELIPTRRTGWVSSERYVRRLVGALGAASSSAWAPADTALGALQDCGVTTLFFALEGEYAKLPADHPLVRLELAADEVRALVDEARDARVASALLWRDASAIDVVSGEDAAQLLVGLATHDPRLAPQGLRAAVWLREQCPDRGTLWDGYRAWLGAIAGAPDLALARAVATERPVDPVGWRLAIEALRAGGDPHETDALIRAARKEPALSALAVELLDTRSAAPVRTMVSGRMTPRWPADGRRASAASVAAMGPF
jgi:hypothetical protein